MKRTVLLATIALLVSTTAAIEGYDGPEDQPHIMSSGSTASGTTAAGPNGTEYRAEVAMRNSSCISGNLSEGLEDINYLTRESYPPQNVVEFTGYIETPNPCYTLDHEIEETAKNNIYVMNITSEASEGNCIQCVGIISYDASFENVGDGFKLEVMHDGEVVETLEHPEFNNSSDLKSPMPPKRKSFIGGIINWFSSLF